MGHWTSLLRNSKFPATSGAKSQLSIHKSLRPPNTTMAKHHPDLIMCRKQPGIGSSPFLHSHLQCYNSFSAIGRLCEKCDGKCVICDSYVRPCTLVRICDECNYGSYQGRCVICGGQGISDAYYCKECTIQEKDRGWSSSCPFLSSD